MKNKVEKKDLRPYDHYFDDIDKLYRSGLVDDAIKKTKDLIESLNYGENPQLYLNSLEKLAQLNESIYSFQDARDNLLEVKKLRKDLDGECHPDYVQCLINLARMYRLLKEFEEASDLLEDAKIVYKEKLGDLKPGSNSFLQKIAIKIEEDNYKPDLIVYTSILSNLAHVYRDMGDNFGLRGQKEEVINYYKTAKRLYREAKRILRLIVGEMDLNYARNIKDFAGLYIKWGRFELLQYGQEIETEYPQVYGESWDDSIQEKFELAEEYLYQADKVYEGVHGKDSISYIHILHDQAKLYYQSNRVHEAGSLYLLIRNKISKILGVNHPYYADILNELAQCYATMGENKKALELMHEVFRIDNQNLSQIYYLSSDRERIRFMRSLDNRLDLFLSLVLEVKSDKKLLQVAFDYVLRRKALTSEVSAFHNQNILSNEYPELSPVIQELNGKRTQISNLALRQLNEEPENYQKKLDRLYEEKKEIKKKIIEIIPEMELERNIQNVDHQSFAGKLSNKSVLVEYVKFYRYNFDSIHNPWKQPAYVVFLLSGEDLNKVELIELGNAQVIESKIAEFNQKLVSYKEIEDSPNLENKGNSIKKLKNAENEFNKTSKELAKALFYPLLPFIKNKDFLFISPDDEISLIPFEILPLENDYVSDEYHITYLGSSRDLLKFSDIQKKPSHPLLISNPDFNLKSEQLRKEESENSSQESVRDVFLECGCGDDIKNTAFQQLPHSTKECGKIVDILKKYGYEDTEHWDKHKALESEIKRIKSPIILHISTHGFFFKDLEPFHMDINQDEAINRSAYHIQNPLIRSGLALAGANTFLIDKILPDDPEDGMLTAEDVNCLNLLNTELVVLSACETALGSHERGEGVFGLRRSFILAGASTLVMSLWKVKDFPTTILMEKFYENLIIHDMSRIQALEKAQIFLRNLTVKDLKEIYESEIYEDKEDNYSPFSHPYYWGAFILQGNPNNLKTKTISEY